MRIPLALLAAALLLAAPAAAQTLRGRVLDASTGQPVAGATVTATTAEGRRAARAATGPDGAFSLQLRRAGPHRLSAERLGYRAATSGALDVQTRETVEVELRLSTADVVLDPLRVTARAEPARDRRLATTGFYDRERDGIGAFVRREDIEKVPTERMTDVLRRVPGVNLVTTRDGETFVVMRAGMASTGNCYPRVVLDGLPLQQGIGSGRVMGRGAASTGNPGLDLNDVIKPGNLEAIEIYRGPAEVPTQFGGTNSACGVIVLWTRTSS